MKMIRDNGLVYLELITPLFFSCLNDHLIKIANDVTHYKQWQKWCNLVF